MRNLLIIAAACLAVSACQTQLESASTRMALALVAGSTGQKIGEAHFYAQGEELTLNLSTSGLAQGTYAVVLVASGPCAADPAQNVTSTPAESLPDLQVSAEGYGTVSALLSSATSNRLPGNIETGSLTLRIFSQGSATNQIGCGEIASITP